MQPGSQPEPHGWVGPPTHTRGEQAGVWRMSIAHPVEVRGMLVFDKLVDMVLGPVLAGGDFKDKSNDQQGLLRVPTRDHLWGQGGGEQDSVRAGDWAGRASRAPTEPRHSLAPAGW